MKTSGSSLFPPINRDPSPTAALRPLLISGMVVPVHHGDGGVNIAMRDNIVDGLLTAIDPYQGMFLGDKHDIFWNDINIAHREVASGEEDKRLFIYLPTIHVVPDWGERVHYRLTRFGSNIPEDSTPLRLRVKLDRPAGTDKDPHLPGHSELAAPGLPQDVIDNGVDAGWAARGVPVEIKAYPGRAAYDTIQLKWGSVILIHNVTEAEAGGAAPISIMVNQAAILAGGDSDALLVHYVVFDEVWNFSTEWSLQTRVVVDAGAWRLDAPIIKESLNGTIDLIALGKNDVTVQIAMTGAPFAVGDSITMTWIGTPATGLPLTHTESVTIASVPTILELKVPYADVRAIAQGSADASYVLNKANGDPPQSSKRTFVDVVGDISLLPAPTIRELIGDVLEPDTPVATVLIPAYPGMDDGDFINMIWLGTTANGTPYVHEDGHPVTANEVGKIIPMYVANEHIVGLAYGTLDLFYTVSNDNKAVFGMSESDHALIKVEAIRAELPAPKVIEAQDGVLDPALVPDSATLLIEYLGTNIGDELTYYWTGKPGSGTGSDWVPITTPTAGKPLTFRIASTLIAPNIGSIVKVRYSLKLKATGNYKYSATLDLTIGSLVGELPEPTVLEAPTGVLNPMDAIAGVVARAQYESMDPALDDITLKWLGTPGAGTSDDLQLPGSSNRYVDFSVPATVVGPNIGKGVDVSYEVKRYGSSTPSQVLKLTVSDFTDPENELPLPRITQANDSSKEFILDSFTGNASVTVAKWPFSAAGQRVWLRLVGAGSTGIVTIRLLEGVAISAGQASAGLNEQVLRSELEKLSHDTALTVICNVTFDGAPQESSAIEFPIARYTFKTFDDSIEPTITSVRDIKGDVLNGGTTFYTEVTLTGTAAASQQVQLFDGATAVGAPVAVNTSGIWTLQLTGLSLTLHSITAKALYGSEPVSDVRTFTVAVATRPTITSVRDSKGEVIDGGITFDTVVTLTGTAAASQQVQLFDGATAVGAPVAVNTSGIWTLQLTGLSVTSHSIKGKGLYGDEPESLVRTFNVATATQPTITSVRDSKGEVTNGGITFDTTVTLTGKAAANQQVQIIDGATAVGTPVTVNATGDWTLQLTGLSLTLHSITAKALYGGEPVSDVRTFNVAVATRPTITSVRDSKGEVANGGSTVDTTVALVGTAAASQQVQILDNGANKTTAPVDTNGNWNSSLSGLVVGGHSITAKGLYASEPVSDVRGFTVIPVTPPLTIDTSQLVLSGRIVRFGRVPTTPPPGAYATRTASGGKPPYTYTGASDRIDVNSATGLVISRRDGQSTVTVRDSEGRTASYPVSVSGATELDGWGGRIIYRQATANAAGWGGHVPSLDEWYSIRACYGGAPNLPAAEGGVPAWSVDSAGGIYHHCIVPNTGAMSTEPDTVIVGSRGLAGGWIILKR